MAVVLHHPVSAFFKSRASCVGSPTQLNGNAVCHETHLISLVIWNIL